MTKTCQPATTAAYLMDANTPTYHTAFRSDMPRTMAHNANRKQDTRLRVKTFGKVRDTHHLKQCTALHRHDMCNCRDAHSQCSLGRC